MPLFNVPQFIERETKIVGPLTLKQVILISILGGICIILYKVLPRFLFNVFLAITFAISIAFFFLKVEGTPLYEVFLNTVYYFLSPKKIFWGKGEGKVIPKFKEMEFKKLKKDKIPVELKRESKLKNLILRIETKK